jgi:hypothetical protein
VTDAPPRAAHHLQLGNQLGFVGRARPRRVLRERIAILAAGLGHLGERVVGVLLLVGQQRATHVREDSNTVWCVRPTAHTFVTSVLVTSLTLAPRRWAAVMPAKPTMPISRHTPPNEPSSFHRRRTLFSQGISKTPPWYS